MSALCNDAAAARRCSGSRSIACFACAIARSSSATLLRRCSTRLRSSATVSNALFAGNESESSAAMLLPDSDLVDQLLSRGFEPPNMRGAMMIKTVYDAFSTSEVLENGNQTERDNWGIFYIKKGFTFCYSSSCVVVGDDPRHIAGIATSAW